MQPRISDVDDRLILVANIEPMRIVAEIKSCTATLTAIKTAVRPRPSRAAPAGAVNHSTAMTGVK